MIYKYTLFNTIYIVDKGLYELLLKVFDVIKAVHAAGHLLGQFFNVRLSSHCLFSYYRIISSYTVFRKVSNAALHTLGNLTILTNSLNPSVSNSNFITKREAIIEQSTLMINRYFYSLEEWNETNIIKRGDSLYQAIEEIWNYPSSS